MSNKKWVFILTFLLSVFYVNQAISWNTVSRAALPLSIVLDGKLSIENYAEFTGDVATINGVPYSDKAPLPGLMLVPVVQVLDWFVDLDELEPQQQLKRIIFIGSILLSVLPFTLIVFFTYSDKLLDKKSAIPLLYLAFFGSFLFILCGVLWNHLLAGLMLLFAYRALQKESWLMAGVFAGTVVACEYNMVVIIAVWGLWMLVQEGWKSALKFTLGTLPFLFLLIFYNHSLTGEWLELAYKYQDNFADNAVAYGFQIPDLSAFLHLTISPYRGLFFYSPILVLVMFAIVKGFKKREGWKKEGMVLSSLIIYFLAICFNVNWVAGWVYGPRFLAPIAILLLYIYLSKVEFEKTRQKVTFWSLGLAGLFVIFIGKGFAFSAKTEVLFPLAEDGYRAMKNGLFSSNPVFHMLGMNDGLSFFLFLLLFGGVGVFLHRLHEKK
jgi:hypothetical protein